MYFASSSESVGKDMLKHANFQYADKTDTATTCMPAQNRRCGCGCECGLVDLYRLGGVMGENFHWRNVKCNWGHRHCRPPFPPLFHRSPFRWNCPIVLKCDVGFACWPGQEAFGTFLCREINFSTPLLLKTALYFVYDVCMCPQITIIKQDWPGAS